jgi:hypothetical protein
LKVFTGSHQISVQSLDASGNTIATANLNVVGEPNDVPPIARVTVTPMPAISPRTVLACSATSSDPDGFINGRQLQFSNGAHFSAPAGLQTFTSPGTYKATVTVRDEFGATDTASTTFVVP